MSARTTKWAWRQDLTQEAKLVLLFLAEKASDDGTSIQANVIILQEWDPAQMRCRFSVRIFNECLSRLVAANLIRYVGGDQWVLRLDQGR
jgi:hypothetical protein